MKNIISLIDANVLINFITKREDPYKDECAVHVNAEYIVTCNAKDFREAKTTIVTPDVFVKIIALHNQKAHISK